ncbi:protein of unknown function [Cupriavidus taiwanensis]|uniref:Uncharacterized protein n=1 Tax=Cupriavidus taiwanensis TaxID=164546 RepID=A0A375IJ23_9BURK|nr:DUF3427 domain-containing protein [Cupriavidus taiwanensis]SPK74001.1 protein of unknown function [Cupriavidus taiwanensis]
MDNIDLQIEKGPTGRIKQLRKLLEGMKREDVLGVLSSFSLEAAAPHGYIQSTDFDLIYEGRRYPPKAVLGLAAKRVLGRPLNSVEFSGGEKSVCFAVLDSLGFEISQKIATKPTQPNLRSLERFQLYDRREIARIFEPEAKFTRGAGRWGIQGIVETPTDSGNFVFMVTLGKPVEGNPYQDALTLDGYLLWESQTQQNFQSRAIKTLLAHDPHVRNIHLFLRPKEGIEYTYLGLLEYFHHDPNKENPVHFIWKVQNWDLNSEKLVALNLPIRAPLTPAYSEPNPSPITQSLVRVAPPAKLAVPRAEQRKLASRSEKVDPVDWAERDLRNRQLGLQGEKLVLQHEIDLLRAADREDLAAQIRHVALYDSAAGFDIASFWPDGRPKRLEVKTTQGPASTPFYISVNEVLASREYADSYFIYRVFDHRLGAEQAKFFELSGDVELSCGLVPITFRAYPTGGTD